ncbi:hypothetical protein BV25DRAFT_134262 [Artomyces pyxidatus]|uniref:Uncharacterized protein n=1 Tax=Artomyces pyxidatus TaxID=48021 RepID=A0ACB8T8I8_9AGAM|nr:hypothetical protein BV25DRAFT_134262 [Artomyces pyxidatus]
MSSDNRYNYQHPQQGGPPFEYPQYPPSSYDGHQFPPDPPPRPSRTSTQSHPPSEPSLYNAASAPYPTYGPTTYPVPQHPPQWVGDGWSHYGQPVAPPPAQDAPVISGPGRPEGAAPSIVQRGFSHPQPNLEPHRNTQPKPAEAPSASKRRQRDKDPALLPPTIPGPSSGIDFSKLLDSYRVIIDTTTALSSDPATSHGRPPPAEALQRMGESANYGLQLLGSGSSPMAATVSEEPITTLAVGTEADANPTRQKSEGPMTEVQTCLGCNATSTPEWRRGPLGPRTLCNACGLVYAKLVRQSQFRSPSANRIVFHQIKKRKREAIRKASQGTGAGGGPSEDLGPSSGEEDEDYAS